MKKFKIKSLKAISAVVAAAVSMTSFQAAQATAINATGRVNNLLVQDQVTGVNQTFFAIVGATSMGNCATFLGLVIFRLKDDLRGQQMYSMVLAAAASGSTLVVSVEDTDRDSSGVCFARAISFKGN